MRNEKGFTLIELLLVVMIIGFMLAVILPRGLRATTDAKYNLVRQNGAEIAAFANDWVEQQILAQDEDSTATRANCSVTRKSSALIRRMTPCSRPFNDSKSEVSTAKAIATFPWSPITSTPNRKVNMTATSVVIPVSFPPRKRVPW